MKAFCLDDHDHDVSIASLSVQIFTVISLVCNVDLILRCHWKVSHYKHYESSRAQKIKLYEVCTVQNVLKNANLSNIREQCLLNTCF